MIAADTNILIRLIVDDHPDQTTLALALLETSRPDSIRIDMVVLAELCWVLKRVYKLSNNQLIDIVEQLLERVELVFDNRSAIMTALRWFEGGRADFADYLIAAQNCEAGAEPTMTFDQNAAAHYKFQLMAE